MLRILWLAPNFNHYKARFLNHLAKDKEVQLTVLSGSGRQKMGDKKLNGDWSFEQVQLQVAKKDFGNSKLVKQHLKSMFADFDWVLIPAEKKNLPLFLFALRLRKTYPSSRLFSYNHPILKSKHGKITFLDKILTKFYYRKLDRVVFYTENSREWALQEKLISSEKSYWANNTIDTIEIGKHYTFELPPREQSTVVFIGRLIKSKRLEDLILYYKRLKDDLPDLKLEIIGDGPEKSVIESAVAKDNGIIWHGTLIDEAKIAPIMKRASFVFIPGHSGLSVNHAFAYGRPYITIDGQSHAPEITYIENGKNGFVLKGDFNFNVLTIKSLLTNRQELEDFCVNANSKGKDLSVLNWVEKMKSSLL